MLADSKLDVGASHVHSVNFLRGEEEDEPLLFFACDLGADTIVTYKADATTAKIKETSRSAEPNNKQPKRA